MKNPSIRFKSTSNVTFPDWEAFPLANFATLHNGRAFKQEELLETGKYPVLRVGNFFTNSKWYFSDLDLDQSKIAEDGDLLYAWSASFGPKIWTGQKVIYHYHIWKITTTDRIDKGFLYFLLQKDALALGKELNGGTMSHLTKASMEARCFRIPSGEEQQKVASFFSTLDQKIELNERKLEALEKLKKGVIQKIFSQKLRFKDKLGNPYPTWKTAPLGYEAFVFDGTHQTPKYTLDGIPFVSVEDINSLSSITKYISEEAYLTDFKASCRAKKGDIFMTRIGDIGTPSICPKDDIAYYVSLALIKCKNNLSNNFLKFAIESDKFQSELRKRSILTAFPKKINTGEIGKCLISLPCMDEQQKIASFFSALDQKIELNERKLEGLKKLKKGLMQQMFI